jgi:hypothetical protein
MEDITDTSRIHIQMDSEEILSGGRDIRDEGQFLGNAKLGFINKAEEEEVNAIQNKSREG